MGIVCFVVLYVLMDRGRLFTFNVAGFRGLRFASRLRKAWVCLVWLWIVIEILFGETRSFKGSFT